MNLHMVKHSSKECSRNAFLDLLFSGLLVNKGSNVAMLCKSTIYLILTMKHQAQVCPGTHVGAANSDTISSKSRATASKTGQPLLHRVTEFLD